MLWLQHAMCTTGKKKEDTHGKNLNAFTSKPFAVNASLISSSVTVALFSSSQRSEL